MSEERFNQLEIMLSQHISHCERRFNERDELDAIIDAAHDFKATEQV